MYFFNAWLLPIALAGLITVSISPVLAAPLTGFVDVTVEGSAPEFDFKEPNSGLVDANNARVTMTAHVSPNRSVLPPMLNRLVHLTGHLVSLRNFR